MSDINDIDAIHGVVLTTMPVDKAQNIDRRNCRKVLKEQIEMPLISVRDKDGTKERHSDIADKPSNSASSMRSGSDASRINHTYSKLKSVLQCLCDTLRERFPGYVFDIPEVSNKEDVGRREFISLSLCITAHGKNKAPLSESELNDVKAYANWMLREAKCLIDKINDAILGKSVKGVMLCNEDRGYSFPILFRTYGVARFVYELFNGDTRVSSHLLIFKIRRRIFQLPNLGWVENNVDDHTYREIKGVVRIESDSKQSFMLEGSYSSSQGDYEDRFCGVIHCVCGYPTDDSDWYRKLLGHSSDGSEVVVAIDSLKSFVSLQGVKSRKYIVVDVKDVDAM